MAKSIYFENCIRAIRQTTFGRDNRRPIADSIEEIKKEATEGDWAIRLLYATVTAITGTNDSYTLELSRQ